MVSFMGREGGWIDTRLTPAGPGAIFTEPYIAFQPFPEAVSAPAPAPAAAPPIEPVLDNNISVSVYGRVIPISAGKRRLPGDLIWLKQDHLNTEGDYTANAAYSFGYRLVQASADLVKVWANGVKIYDAETGFQAEGFTFVFYDGSQTEIDPEISADKGADITPAFKEQLYIRGIFPTKEFNGSLPNISALVSDGPGDFRTFRPWSNLAAGGKLNPDDKSSEIELTNSDLTAERVTSASPAWRAVRGTVGRPSNQPDGHGWFVYEAKNDVISALPILGGQGPGLATGTYDVDAGVAGDAQSLWFNPLGGIFFNNTSIGVSEDAGIPLETGQWTMFATRLDLMKIWKGVDGASWDAGGEGGGSQGDPIEDINGVDISFMSGQTVYPAWFSDRQTQKTSFNFTGPFINTPPGQSSGGGITSASTLTEIIVSVGTRCGFDPADFRFTGLDGIKVTGIVITSDTDFLSFLKNSARVYGFDYTESGGQILCRKAVIGTSYTVDIGDIPEAALIPTSNEAAVTTTRDNSHRPEIIELAYQDETIDYQPSVQRARIPRIRSPMTDKFGIPYVMSSQEAITGAATALYREHFARVSHSFQLPFQYQRIEPTDLIEFTSSGKAYTVKVSNVVRNSDLSVRLTAVNLLIAEAEPITDAFTGENYQDYHGGGQSGDPNIDRPPLEILPDVAITSSAFSAAENQTAIGTLAATGGATPYTWTKTGGADAAKFNLSAGVLSFVTAPDFEAPTDADGNNVYVVDVKVTDSEGRTDTATISVTVTDVSEVPPLVVTSPSTFSVVENTTAVATLTATGGSGGYTWTKTGGADTAKFNLTSGGVLSFAAAPDFEAPTDANGDNVYLVTVNVSDGTRNTPQSISVTVTNVGELFTNLDYSLQGNSGYVIFLEDI